MQSKLDEYCFMHNTSKPCKDRKKLLPTAIPELALHHPKRYGALSFKVSVSEDELQEVEQLYAPPEHEVFKLVPTFFKWAIESCYFDMGSPTIMLQTFWTIY
ncbi:hypothetical protein DACRYDRAFT_107254 [Dacryopinax primogenitus]|uniref:Uncharacterized protein n=1 Tax=Dacryopinax primogenitus (strain DJM 731) TaxID=1858805 RepID=M5GDE9_DACPD|nr:uncharacterized protein DACRYDRAFT_107254 [Dacryopinax primogenitus]EJU02328.1 hypothetical protein DACRYDRAFT_107254 [Dacryopinax primogenitus]